MQILSINRKLKQSVYENFETKTKFDHKPENLRKMCKQEAQEIRENKRL